MNSRDQRSSFDINANNTVRTMVLARSSLDPAFPTVVPGGSATLGAREMSQEIDLKQIMHKAGGYAPESYRFIRDGLAHTVRVVHGDTVLEAPPSSREEEDSRHVSGPELCDGLRDFGVKQYGLLARTVLSRWGIRSTEDFGKIIFAMVEAGLMRTTEDDRLEDFVNVYNFDDVFREPEHSGPIGAGSSN